MTWGNSEDAMHILNGRREGPQLGQSGCFKMWTKLAGLTLLVHNINQCSFDDNVHLMEYC